MDASQTYNQRYAEGYREVLNGFEVARAAALLDVLTRVLTLSPSAKVLDYGAGSGLFSRTLEQAFPEGELYFTDISAEAMHQLGAKYPGHAARAVPMETTAPFADASFDVVVSVEVMEHVEDLEAYLRDVYRLLKPGGVFVWTTPCANAWSVEWLYSQITRKVIRQEDGINWTWDEKGHVRRVKTGYITKRLEAVGLTKVGFRMRSHFFSWTCTQLMRLIPKYRVHKMLERLMLLDYALFRRLPNGASMVGFAFKA